MKINRWRSAIAQVYSAFMSDYYAEKLSGERLKRCYEIASPRVRGYLDAEIQALGKRLRPGMAALELGCGTARVLGGLTAAGARLFGIDNARASLQLAAGEFGTKIGWVLGDAHALPFAAGVFDLVFCVQNGPAAIGDGEKLLAESLRVTAAGGRVVFSSYLDDFWDARLDWFRRQSAEGLLGAIDEKASGDGVIVCEDGLRLGRVSAEEFRSWNAPVKPRLREVDGSSLFAEWKLPERLPASASAC